MFPTELRQDKQRNILLVSLGVKNTSEVDGMVFFCSTSLLDYQTFLSFRPSHFFLFLSLSKGSNWEEKKKKRRRSLIPLLSSSLSDFPAFSLSLFFLLLECSLYLEAV